MKINIFIQGTILISITVSVLADLLNSCIFGVCGNRNAGTDSEKIETWIGNFCKDQECIDKTKADFDTAQTQNENIYGTPAEAEKKCAKYKDQNKKNNCLEELKSKRISVASKKTEKNLEKSSTHQWIKLLASYGYKYVSQHPRVTLTWKLRAARYVYVDTAGDSQLVKMFDFSMASVKKNEDNSETMEPIYLISGPAAKPERVIVIDLSESVVNFRATIESPVWSMFGV